MQHGAKRTLAPSEYRDTPAASLKAATYEFTQAGRAHQTAQWQEYQPIAITEPVKQSKIQTLPFP
jgi:hypothetical protein